MLYKTGDKHKLKTNFSFPIILKDPRKSNLIHNRIDGIIIDELIIMVE